MAKQNTGRAARQPPLILASDIAQRLGIRRRDIEQKVKQMLDKRNQYEVRWKAIRDYQLPNIGRFDGVDDEDNLARRRDRQIYNSTTEQANQIFAAGVMSGLTPPSRRWFRLDFADKELKDNSDLGELLDERLDIMADVLEKSNFYTAVHSCYLELAFGQAPLGIFPDAQHGVHFASYPVGTYCLENGPDGTVETFCRRYKMSAYQLAEKFGLENLPPNIRDQLQNSPGYKVEHKVVWFVEKNPCADSNKLGNFHLPYLCAYYLENSDPDHWLYLGGFHEWPVPVARYQVTGNEPYAQGPGWFAEGDSKQLQLLERDKLTAVELEVKPPMLTTADSAAKGINLVPGGKTFTQSQGGVVPLFQVQSNLQHLEALIATVEGRIKRAYSADLFMMLDQMEDKTMTAREVIERNQEKMTVLGPVVQRMQFEFLGRIIERVYNILDREQMFPQPQDEEMADFLAKQELKIEYISPLAQAQKMSGLVNIEQSVAFAGQLAQFKPEILDKLDWNETINRYFDLIGAPSAIKRTDDEYQQIQQQKAQEAAQAQQMQQAAQLAQMAAPAAQAAKNATEAAQDGNPALRELMGIDQYGYGQGSA